MYQEIIGKHIADHLRGHIEGLLDEVATYFADTVLLIPPKSIEPASIVGGLMTSYAEILPQYGIDINDKSLSSSNDSLWDYEYSGQINGLVHAGSRAGVDTIVKRHATACEIFMRRHQFMHQFETPEFLVTELLYGSTAFSGAEDVGEVNGSQLWIAAFSLDFVLWTSEDGPVQHG